MLAKHVGEPDAKESTEQESKIEVIAA